MFSAAYFLSSNTPILGITVHYFMYRRIALSLCFTLFLGLLSACSPKGILHLKKDESNILKPAKNNKNDAEISTPIALPPSFNHQPLKAGQLDTQYMPNGMPALKPMKGVNADILFSENIKNTGERFNRVENAVVDLRKEFEIYKPSIVRLAAVESDIQNLIKELEVLLQETPNLEQPLDLTSNSDKAELQVSQLDPQPVMPQSENQKKQSVKKVVNKPPPAKTKPKEKPPPAKPQYDGIVAKNLRAGEHADKLRIVIDTNKYTDFTIDLDNDEKLIIIEMPKARWIGNESKNFKSSKLLESFSVEPINNGKGSMIILSLRKDTSIMQEKRLSPDASNPYHRIYFDLKP